MNTLTRIALLTLLFTLLCGSCSTPHMEEQWNTIEGLMNERPDSALTLLQAIDPKPLSRGDRAHHALLLSQALDKNYIDLTGDSIINIAVDYYEKSNDTEHLFLAYYYQGRIYANAERLHDALNSYTQAQQLADNVDNDCAKGLLYAQMGSIYQHSFSIEKALDAYKLSLHYYNCGKYTRNIPFALRNIGVIYYRTNRFEEAENYLSQAVAHFIATERWEYAHESLKFLAHTYIYSNNFVALDSLVNTPHFATYPRNDVNYYYIIAFLAAHKGNSSQVDSALQYAQNQISTSQDTTDYYYNVYRIRRLQHDNNEALLYFEKSYLRTHIATRKALEQPLLTAQRDFYQKQNELKTAQNKILRERHLLLWAATIIIVLIAVVILLLARNHISQKESIIAQHLNTIQDLKLSVAGKSGIIDELSSQIDDMMQQFFKEIDLQYQLISESESASNKADFYYKRMRKRIDKMNAGSDFYLQIENVVNRYRENVMVIARDNLKLSESDYQLLCYIYARLSDGTIALFLSSSLGSIYTRKSRIKKKINERNDDVGRILQKHLP